MLFFGRFYLSKMYQDFIHLELLDRECKTGVTQISHRVHCGEKHTNSDFNQMILIVYQH